VEVRLDIVNTKTVEMNVFTLGTPIKTSMEVANQGEMFCKGPWELQQGRDIVSA